MAGFTTRPVIMGTHGVVTSGHYLATAAGFRIMQQGGNAIDAAATMCFCLNLLEPQSNGIGGEVPTLIYSAPAREVFAISGMGWSPQAFTIDWCRAQGLDLIPGDGYLPACVPAVVDTWAAALARFGTMSFSQVLQPAIELAARGFRSLSACTTGCGRIFASSPNSILPPARSITPTVTRLQWARCCAIRISRILCKQCVSPRKHTGTRAG